MLLTQAQIAAQAQTLAAIRDLWNDQLKPQVNSVVGAINSNRAAKDSTQLSSTANVFGVVTRVLNNAIPVIQAALAETAALVPSDPPVDPPVEPQAGPLTLTLKNTAGSTFWFSSGCILPNGKIYQPWADGTRMWDAATGDLVITAMQHLYEDGTPMASNQVENSDCCSVDNESAIYHGSAAPGGLFYRFVRATGVLENVAAYSVAHAKLFHDKQFNRLIALGGFVERPCQINAWPLPIPLLSATPATPGVQLPITGDVPVISNPSAVYTDYRAAISSQGRIGLLADLNEVYELTLSADGNSYVGVHRPTTGTKPPTFAAMVLYEPWDAYIAACGANGVATNDDLYDKFWILPRGTWRWDSLAVNMPELQAMASLESNIILADPERSQVIVLNCRGRFQTIDMRGGANTPSGPPVEPPVIPPDTPPVIVTPPVVVLPPPPETPVEKGVFGELIGLPISANPYAPLSVKQSKQVMLCALDNDNLLTIGGDFGRGSANNSEWLYRLISGGEPIMLTPDEVPTAAFPFPDSYQDGCLVEILGPDVIVVGSAYAYHEDLTQAVGMWRSSIASILAGRPIWRQDLSLWGRNQHNEGTGLGPTGTVYGGLLDPVKKLIFVMRDEIGSQGPGIDRYDIGTEGSGRQLPFIPFVLPPPPSLPGYRTSIFTRGRHTRIDRTMFFYGYSTDGTGYIYRMWKMNLDSFQIAECARPPIAGLGITDIWFMIAAAGNKVVLLAANDPSGGLITTPDAQGNYLTGRARLFVNDPGRDVWAEDTQTLTRPDDEGFYGNTICTHPDNGVVIGGGIARRIYRYRPNQ